MKLHLIKASFQIHVITKVIYYGCKGNYAKIFPLSYYFERPKILYFMHLKIILMTYCQNEVLIRLFQRNAIVLEKNVFRWLANYGQILYLCRGIAIDFKDSGLYSG